MHQLAKGNLNVGQHRLTQNEMDNEVKSSASKMMNSAVFGQIIILIVYLPIFSLQGIEGKMFKPMAQTVAFALLGAFILSLTYIPMMSAWVLSKKTTHKENISDRMMAKVEKGFRSLFDKVLTKAKLVYISVAVLFILAMITMTRLGGEFIPALEEGDFAVETRVLTGSNLHTSIENSQKAAKILLERFPEVIKVVSKIGSGEVPTDPMPMEAADLMIILKDKSEWQNASTFDELAKKMGEELKDVPGVTFGFQYPVQMRFNELMTGAKQDVVCKIFGENLDTLALYAEKLGKLANTVDGSANLFVEPVTGMPQIIVDYDRNALAQYHISIEDVNKVVNAAFAGQTAGMIFEDEKRFNLVVRLKKEKRSSLEDVQNLLIPSPNGPQIPLSILANVSIEDGPNQIQREDAKRRIVVGFNVRDRDVQSLVSELQEKVSSKLNLPPGYYVTYGGAFENLQAANQRLAIAVPIALLLIFILLYFAFGSIRHGLIIYTAIPLSAMGGIFFLALRGLPFSISAGVGFIALFGVAVLNGIVLLAEFNRLKKNGMTDLKEIVKTGTESRLRPVLMTAFVASLGFLPMALSNGAGAEVQRPLATVVIGGLMIATFLTLFVLPLLYIFVEGRTDRKLKMKTLPLVIGFIFIGTSALNAQKTIDLQSAIDLALKQNLSLNSDRLLTNLNENSKRSGVQIDNTTVDFQYGQMNSVFNDNGFSVGQGFRFPTVYKNEKNRLTEQWNYSLINVQLKEKEITRMVEQTFYSIITAREKERLLLRVDSLYNNFQKKAKLKLAAGENNGMDVANAEIQMAAIQQQLVSLKNYRRMLHSQFQILLHNNEEMTPIDAEPKVKPFLENDSTLVLNHPMLTLAKKQIELEELKKDSEKTKFLPDFKIAYNNMTMRGTGADNILYDGYNRFQSVSAGIGIPIFNRHTRTNVQNLKIQKSIAENELAIKEEMLLEEYKQAWYNYQQNNSIVEYYEEKVLPSTKSIYQKADMQLQQGEISSIEWGFLINQAIDAENKYIEGIQLLNESLIQLHFLTNK
jgi:cobalt-zinc-cadmium resistance protein CzcA